MKERKSYFSIKERDKMKKKGMAIALATGIIVGNFPTNFTYAETNVIDRLNSELGINVNENISDNKNVKINNNFTVNKTEVQEINRVILNDGRTIRAVKDTNGQVTLQELDTNSQWIDRDIIGQVEIKEMKATDDGGYKVVYLDNVKVDYFKYSQAYDKASNKIADVEIVGIEILTDEDATLSLDLVVDKNKNTTIIKSSLEEVTIKEFVPTLVDYSVGNHIMMFGIDSIGNTTVLLVTGNGKVINGDIIKDLNYIQLEYKEVKSVGIAVDDDGLFIISGYAVKDTDPDKKDGFLMEFDENGNKNSEMKIIPHSYSEKNDATINSIIKFNSGNIRIQGPNINTMYINSLNYVDTRPIKESLTLASGKSYKVAKETNTSRVGSDETNTFTVKSVNDIFEYDIATYKNVQDVKLVPGNNNQVIIAVSNNDNSTEVGIINTDYDGEVNSKGEVVSKVVNVGKIEDNNGPILNIDIDNIKVKSNGKLSITTTNSATPIDVNVNEVEAGTPIDVIKENPVVESQNLYFNRSNPKDVVIKNVDFKGTTLTRLSMGGKLIDMSKVKFTNNSIIIPKEVLKDFKIDNGNYALGLSFSDGSYFMGTVYIEIVGRDIESTPTIGKQDLSFDKNNPEDMVIKNVDFKGVKLNSISVGGNHIDISTVATTENTIIIPKEFFINLSLENGKYYVTFKFEDGSASFQDVTVDITGNVNPVIEEQTVSFNRNKPQDIVIKNAYLKGLNLRYIYINGKAISASSVKVEEDKIIIPTNVLESLGLVNVIYDISFKFQNGTTLVNTVYLNVTDTSDEGNPDEKPPVEEEKPEEKPDEKPPVEE